ncbi:hypothetical protein FGG08_007374 [Glutinoglossum americanum]|uniref:GAR domain-containing protein n=1 Tax=Glutinoglossum americanum TaxID=1670608 RepID=A0A9P8HYZ5_9PEZI|nr:hypothetical protein FGG08_007374 [Glutinoglossum americanum]
MSEIQFGAGNPSHPFVPLRRLTTRSPSPSRSPTRGGGFTAHVLDPLLSDLSPSKTLEALSSSPTFVGNGGRSSALQASIAVASPAQRAFAVRAALAHKKLREWSVELSSWEWPTKDGLSETSRGFQVPSWEERAAKRRRMDSGLQSQKKSWGVVTHGGGGLVTSQKASLDAVIGSSSGFGASDDGDDGDDDVEAGLEPDDEYWGSLPAYRVLEYEERVETIKGEMEALDLEELKSQVLDAHIPSRSRPSSSYDLIDDEPSLENYVPLGDFTALITATTLQALPYLSRVIGLLNTWVIRIAVLKVVPKFLANLEEVEDLVKLAFGAIVVSTATPHASSQRGKLTEKGPGPGALRLWGGGRNRLLPIPPDEDFTRSAFNAVREMLERKVTSLGQLLDSMLDDLEGRDDTIPEEWIEKMEAAEESYGNWVIEAEKKVLEAEWRRSFQAQAEQLTSAQNSKKADAGKDIVGKAGANGDDPAECEVSAQEEPVGGAHDIAEGGASKDVQAIQCPDLLPVQQPDDTRVYDRADEVELAGDVADVTGVKEDTADNWEADIGGVCDPVLDETSVYTPAMQGLDLPSAQPTDDSHDYERTDKVDPDEDTIEITEIKEDETNHQETDVDGTYILVPSDASGDISTSPSLDSPPAQLDATRDFEEVEQACQVLERDMTNEIIVAEDTTGVAGTTSSQISENTLDVLDVCELNPPLASQVSDARTPEKAAVLDDDWDMVDGSDTAEQNIRIVKAASGQSRENGAEASGVYCPTQGIPTQLSTTQNSDSPPPIPEVPIIGKVSSDGNTTDDVFVHVISNAIGTYPTTETNNEGQEPVINNERPETPPLQRPLPLGSPTISPPTSQRKAGRRSPLGTVDSGDIRYNISNPVIVADAGPAGASSTEHPTSVENDAFFNPKVANKDCTAACLASSNSVETLPDKPVHGENNSHISVRAKPSELPTATSISYAHEIKPLVLASPWTTPVRPDFDSDNSQTSPNLSIQSSSSSPTFQTRGLEPPRFGRPTDNTDSLPPISGTHESLSSRMTTESKCMTNENVGPERQLDLDLNREGLGIRDIMTETVSHISLGGGTSATEATGELDIHGGDQPEATPRDAIPQFQETSRSIDLSDGGLPQEESIAGAESERNEFSVETPITTDSGEVVLDSVENFNPENHGQPDTVELEHSISASPSLSESSYSPETAALEVPKATGESSDKINSVESDSPSPSPSPPSIKADATVGCIASAGECLLTRSDENANSSPKVGAFVTIDTHPNLQPHLDDTPDGNKVVPTSEGTPETLKHSPVSVPTSPAQRLPLESQLTPLQAETPNALWTRSPYSSPLTMDNTPQGAGPRTPMSSESFRNLTRPRRSEPPTPLPSLSINDVEEQSPSVRQYLKRHDTGSSEDDPLGSLPALQIPKRRQRTYSSPEKSLVVPGRPQQKGTDTGGAGSENTYSRGPIELSKAIVLESPVENADDHLEQKINSILTTIPARIRLSSELEAEPSPNGRSSPPKSYATVSPGVRPLRATSASPSFTLAPAYAKNPRPRAKGSNPDIKLYHLHRSSGEAPIKLFVRLVGENGERVMVRVGGGWADLGEYLKEYATHHGRRSTSDGRIEIQDVPKLNSKGSVASLKAQATGRSTPTSRPPSSLDRSTSLPFARSTRNPPPSTPPTTTHTPTTPTPQSQTQFPTIVSRRAQELTPPSNGSSVSSSARSSSRLSWTEEEPAPALGLAGPKSRKVDMAPDRQAWVEGVLGQVRKASAQKREENDFGSLGRIGGTKRVFRRGSKGGREN